MRSREVEKKICEHTNKNSDCSQKMETTANGAQKALNQAPHKDLLTDPFSVEHMMRDNAKEYARSRLESLSKEAYLESLSIQADWRNRVGAREAVQCAECLQQALNRAPPFVKPRWQTRPGSNPSVTEIDLDEICDNCDRSLCACELKCSVCDRVGCGCFGAPHPKYPSVTEIGWGRIVLNWHGHLCEGTDVLLCSAGVFAWDWAKTDMHHSPGVRLDDLAPIWGAVHGADDSHMTRLIIGQGMHSKLQVTEEVKSRVRTYCAQTEEAIKIYYEMTEKGVPVVALLHTTC